MTERKNPLDSIDEPWRDEATALWTAATAGKDGDDQHAPVECLSRALTAFLLDRGCWTGDRDRLALLVHYLVAPTAPLFPEHKVAHVWLDAFVRWYLRFGPLDACLPKMADVVCAPAATAADLKSDRVVGTLQPWYRPEAERESQARDVLCAMHKAGSPVRVIVRSHQMETCIGQAFTYTRLKSVADVAIDVKNDTLFEKGAIPHFLDVNYGRFTFIYKLPDGNWKGKEPDPLPTLSAWLVAVLGPERAAGVTSDLPASHAHGVPKGSGGVWDLAHLRPSAAKEVSNVDDSKSPVQVATADSAAPVEVVGDCASLVHHAVETVLKP